MACKTRVRETLDAHGNVTHLEFCCSGNCDTSANSACCVQINYTPNGVRMWCGCGPVEPPDCHLVATTLPSGGAPKITCEGKCAATTQHCKLSEKVISAAGQPKVVEFACTCA